MEFMESMQYLALSLGSIRLSQRPKE